MCVAGTLLALWLLPSFCGELQRQWLPMYGDLAKLKQASIMHDGLKEVGCQAVEWEVVAQGRRCEIYNWY